MAASKRARAPPTTDLTSDFRQLISERAGQYPPSSSSASGSKALKRKDPPENVVRAHKQWLQQAYVIRKHIISLLGFLFSIRRRYLALGNKARHHQLRDAHEGLETPDDQDATAGSAFAKWKAFTGPLNDTQRDEIDFQVKVVVKRCLESIKELERAEEARKKNAPTTPTALSPLNSLLALSTARDSSTSILASSLISAHRASITQYLSALLSKASSLQGDMQEARLRVQREKTRSLANSRLELQERAGAAASQATAASTAPTVIRGSVGGSFDPQLDSETDLVGKDISAQLSASQIEMFENESSELIKSLESDLASIKKAESRLYEISELQTQVVQQLEQQGEVTDQLLDEAIGVGTEVGRGNEELRKARQRSREADKFLSIFLVGSGLALLFLHWMD
ncbi:snare protein syntaxin 18 ufe1 [Moesziomyces antarcticus]|uniref:Related to syntaxin 18 n=1 Tax=Pseudozyma antarctica TaxID=84753 RepID=A0A5C3FGN7_PSEA2|nr:snare protein syntaxin 18 ufe1 [Moesziomyces antarcticus]GAK62331.1 snare protein syntaxin 18 ufe1 [Moesziomyces antarcticus]SPO42875.1 related to syntaxin 18 [Moesziomyces antarcticus]